MNRKDMLNKLQEPEKVWDMVVVGGGATGLGVAVDAATRGYSVVLLDMADLAKSTSSRSTKLVHGGVRYLQKGDVALVLEALRERGRMKANAPHLVKDQAFVISNYTYWDNFLYFCGIWLHAVPVARRPAMVSCVCGRMWNLFMPDSSTWFSCPAPRQIRRSLHKVVAGSEYIGLPAFQGFLYLGRLAALFLLGRTGRRTVPPRL